MLKNHFQGLRAESAAGGCDGVDNCDGADNGVAMYWR